MNFLGMGTLEILVVLVVAFIFLGPERMVDAARMLGKFVREARRMASELPSLDMDEDSARARRSSVVQRSVRPHSQAPSADVASSQAADEAQSPGDGPVPHQRAVSAAQRTDAEARPQQEPS